MSEMNRLAPDDAKLAALLQAAAAPAESPLPGEAAALAAFRELHGRGPGRRGLAVVGGWARTGRRSPKLVAAATFGAVVMATGAAAAATGSLPLTPLGSVTHLIHPAHPAHPVAPSHPAVPAAPAPSEPTTGQPGVHAGAGGGACDGSGTSRTVPGAAVCPAASHDSCAAGQHGTATRAHGQPVPKQTPASSSATHGKSKAAEHRRNALRRTHHRQRALGRLMRAGAPPTRPATASATHR